MFFKQPFLEAILGSSFGMSAFIRDISMDIFVNLMTKSNCSPAIVGPTKLPGAGVINSSALCRTLHGHELPSTSATDSVVLRSVKAHENFSSLPYSYPETLLHGISDAQILFLVQRFRANGFHHERKTISVTSATMPDRSDACEGAPASTPRVLDGAASVILLDGRDYLQALLDLLEARDVA